MAARHGYPGVHRSTFSESHPMTSIRSLLLPFALLGFSGGAAAEGIAAKGWSADWKVVGVAEDRTEVLMRPGSVRELPPGPQRTFAVRQVWAGFDYAGTHGLHAARKIALFRYDCAGRRLLVAAATDYAANGVVLARNAVDADRADQYLPVEPDTLGAAIMDKACAA
ncbi:hypothetical protein Saro_0471 [Novosphingobium aromaticivorans DSM 12444]|uniref:Uncharacterized protein n=1 Tax=Novosphingobium aromaticivorans (strain ATCC 700278 / DSM 12444 / CCUG 56034 / CIP 105152 / NBRC 16084 / F199) TaxID=279238 RepID=Q2GB54_NOVAD|nr:hypothetical protein [Novosphingobium aromaticivorans]ABD24919.1 hypothetical protein Saro_0471 [Novosphingobium aromaticivorans DSM 12444]SCY94293.1 hypothetical protein SAMN05660666_03783 [Novosphingobium aromaticivorans]